MTLLRNLLIFLFQFHKGAIGVVKQIMDISVIELFQFHKGAIGVCTLPAVTSIS